MKRVLSATFLLSALLFAACSNSGTSDEKLIDGENTLKHKIAAKSETSIWTYELEPETLTKDLSRSEGFSENVQVEPYIASLSIFQNEKIYPELKDFGSLENESLKRSTYNLVSDFFQTFITSTKKTNEPSSDGSSITSTIYDGEKYIRKDSIFTFVFFLEDLKLHYEDFGKPDSKFSFYRFEIGKSYMSGKEVQVPVRLYVKDLKNYIDVNVFVDETANLISQIKIERIK